VHFASDAFAPDDEIADVLECCFIWAVFLVLSAGLNLISATIIPIITEPVQRQHDVRHGRCSAEIAFETICKTPVAGSMLTAERETVASVVGSGGFCP